MFAIFFWTGHWALAQAWETELHRDDIRIQTCALPESSWRAFRAETRVAAPAESVLAMIHGVGGFPNWLHGCRSASLLESRHGLHGLARLTRESMEGRRHSILMLDIETRELEGGEFEVTLQQRPQDFTAAEAPRGGQAQARVQLLPIGDAQTHVTWENYTAARANFSPALIRRLLVEAPFATLQNLKTVLQNPNAPCRNVRLHRAADGHPVGWISSHAAEVPLVLER